MRPRSTPWLLLHVVAIAIGTIQFFAAIAAFPTATETAYGQGALAGRLVWVAIAVFAAVRLRREYGSGSGSSAGASANPAHVPMGHPGKHTPFECTAPVAQAYGVASPARWSARSDASATPPRSTPPPRG